MISFFVAFSLGSALLPTQPAPSEPAPPVSPAPITAPTVAVSAEAAGVSATARLVAADGAEVVRVRLAESVTLRVELAGPPGVAFFPPFRPAVGTFELLPARPPEPGKDATRHIEIWSYDLLAVRLGIERVPAVEIPYRLPDGSEGSVSTPVLRLDVEGHLTNSQDPPPAPPPAPVPVVTTDWALIWALSVGGALLIALLLAFLVLKALESRFRSLAPLAPPRPPIDVALERLDAIEADVTIDGPTRHAALVDALRAYLSGRYSFDGLEMTSRETLHALESVDLKSIPIDDIASLLAESDLVKFAGSLFDDETARARLPRVREIVVATWEPPAAAEVDETPRAEPATLRQRLMAGAVDGVLGLLGGLGVFGVLWTQGLLEFGWAGLALTGVYLALRDVFGRSLGKTLLGLSIANRDLKQAPAPLSARLTRNALLLVWPIVAPVEMMTIIQHPLRVRVGDLMANTDVVQGNIARRNP